MATVQNISVPGANTIGGNTSATDNAALNIINAIIFGILEEKQNTLALRMTATGGTWTSSPMTGFATARFYFTDRVVWGNQYDFKTGAPYTQLRIREVDIHVDQIIAIKFMTEQFDMSRFSDSDPDVQANAIAIWNQTLQSNLLYILDAEFLLGVYDEMVATGQYIVAPFQTYTDNAAIMNSIYDIQEALINLQKYFDYNVMGTAKSDYIMALGVATEGHIARAYMNFNYVPTQLASATLLSGDLPVDSVLGVSRTTSNLFEQTFTAGTDRGLNKDKTYDFKNLNGIMIHKMSQAMPIGYTNVVTVIDNETFNPKTGGKCMYGIVTGLRSQLAVAILETQPTADQITNAQANRGVTYDLEPWKALVPPTPELMKLLNASNRNYDPTNRLVAGQVKGQERARTLNEMIIAGVMDAKGNLIKAPTTPSANA